MVDRDAVLGASIAEARRAIRVAQDARAGLLDLRKHVLSQMAELSKILSDIDEALHEVDQVSIQATDEAFAPDPAILASLVKAGGSATDFTLAVVALGSGSATAGVVLAANQRAGDHYSETAIHGALHRLTAAKKIARTSAVRGAPYRLTRVGSAEWAARMRKEGAAK